MQSVGRTKRLLAATTAIGLATLVVLGVYLIHVQRQAMAQLQDEAGPQTGGTLIICGGGSLPKEVVARFIRCAGGKDGKVVIIPAYHPTPAEKRELLTDWKGFGAGKVVVLAATTRQQANDAAKQLSDATGVWISGGNQRHLAEIYVDTEVERELGAVLDRGGVVGGISAGAAIMTQTMIIGGGSQLALEQRGFDLLPGTVVDQHFLHRNRASRLLRVLNNHPDLVGLGIDEHTAVVVERMKGRWSVIGKSYAMICLPSEDGFPRLEILKPGDSTEIDALRDEPGEVAISSSAFWDSLSGGKN